VSYVQRRVDAYYDVFYGSKFTYRRRIWLCLGILVLCLIIAPFVRFYGLIAICVVIGCCTWVCHGITTSLAGIVQMKSGIMQQIGFALPAVYGIIANLSFKLSRDNVPASSIFAFYFTSAAVATLGIAAWAWLCQNDVVRDKLLMKDERLGGILIKQAHKKKTLRTPLLDNIAEECESTGRFSDVADVEDDNGLALSTTPPASSFVFDRGTSFTDVESKTEKKAEGSLPINSPVPSASRHSSTERFSFLFSMFSKDTDRIVADSRALLRLDPGLLEDAMKSSHCKEIMEPYRWTLFCTIYASILQGTFISYTYGCVLFGVIELPTVLYFVRIFSDLFGRPLALAPVPSFFKDIKGLLVGSMIRTVSMLYFFSIIANITIYQKSFVDSNVCHMLLLIFQVFFSALSGYFNCLTYEYSARAFDDEWLRVIASQYLNLTFQKACTAAVVTAIAAIVFVDVIKPALGLHIDTTDHIN